MIQVGLKNIQGSEQKSDLLSLLATKGETKSEASEFDTLIAMLNANEGNPEASTEANAALSKLLASPEQKVGKDGAPVLNLDLIKQLSVSNNEEAVNPDLLQKIEALLNPKSAETKVDPSVASEKATDKTVKTEQPQSIEKLLASLSMKDEAKVEPLKTQLQSAKTNVVVDKDGKVTLEPEVASVKNPDAIKKLQLGGVSSEMLAEQKSIDGEKKAVQMPKVIPSSYKVENNVLSNNLIKFEPKKITEESFSNQASKIEGVELKKSDVVSPAVSSVLDFVPQVKLEGSNLQQGKADATLDMSKMSANSPEQIINKIIQHIEANKLATSGSVKMDVFHPELGQFSIKASKTGVADQVTVKIDSATTAGHNFFLKHEGQLSEALLNANIKVSELKIVSSKVESHITDGFAGMTRSENSSSSSFSQDGKGFERGQSSFSFSQKGEQGEGQTDSERRRALWEMFKQKANA